MRQARAVLASHGTWERGRKTNTKFVTPEELKDLPTPEGTRTWHPIPHYEVYERTRDQIVTNGWRFAFPEKPFQFVVTETHTKLFGTTTIIIPGIAEDPEIQLALGIRNSHDKTISLNYALGSRVFICSNMAIVADFVIRRSHTSRINIDEVIKRAFDQVPQAAKRLIGWTGSLRERPISPDIGVSLLAEAVEKKALQIGDFMPARADFLSAYAGENPEIHYGRTYWAAYQAITAQYRYHDLSVNQSYAANLNMLFADKVGA